MFCIDVSSLTSGADGSAGHEELVVFASATGTALRGDIVGHDVGEDSLEALDGAGSHCLHHVHIKHNTVGLEGKTRAGIGWLRHNGVESGVSSEASNISKRVHCIVVNT